MSLQEQISAIGKRARAASRALARLNTDQKNRSLIAMADALCADESAILEANAKDVSAAKANGISGAMLDRLSLTAKRVHEMADGVRKVAELPDPAGETIKEWTRPNGLRISKVRVPIGVVGIIYESRPNVTCDAAVLCVKTGNATILRGGSESIHSNIAISKALQRGGEKAGLPANAIQLIPTTDREAVKLMAQMDSAIDVIVPRGGHALIEAVVTHARMPVIKHYQGICAVYVDREADLEMAKEIVFNAKTQRPGVCNAMETLIVHREIADEFFKKLAPVFAEKNVELHADESAHRSLTAIGYTPLREATEEDWKTEYLDLICAVRTVANDEEAIEHIEANGSHHSDCIVTKNVATAEKFLREIDSAAVYWNASTRFTDGAEFGFGAEIGISTDKLHARGPMALEELTTYKYLLRGEGQIR